eukprot:410972-Rhodomonas_salina.1
MITQWERATNKQSENFTTDLNNYPELVWNAAATNTNIKDSLVTESNAAVKDKLCSRWTEWQSCCYSTKDAYNRQVKRIHLQFLIKINLNHIIIEKILNTIYGPDISKKGSLEAEALLQMLITQEVKELLSGSVNAYEWQDKPHRTPAVQMWAKICFKYLN